MPPSHLLLIVLINFVGGANIVLTKIVFEQFPPVLFSALRFALILAILFPFLKHVQGKMRLLVATSLCLGALHFTLVYIGLQRAEGVASVAIVAQLFVPFSTLLSVIFLHEKIGWRRILGIVMAFSGVMILGFEPSVLADPVSLALVIVGALVAAIGTIFMKRLGDVGVFELQAWIALISLPLLLLTSLLMESGQLATIRDANMNAWLILLFSVLGASLLGQGGMFWLIQRHDVSRISPTTLLSTIFGVGLGIAFLGEELTLRMIGGGTVALAGVLMIALRQPRRGPPPVLSQPIIATANAPRRK